MVSDPETSHMTLLLIISDQSSSNPLIKPSSHPRLTSFYRLYIAILRNYEGTTLI